MPAKSPEKSCSKHGKKVHYVGITFNIIYRARISPYSGVGAKAEGFGFQVTAPYEFYQVLSSKRRKDEHSTIYGETTVDAVCSGLDFSSLSHNCI